jgi:hypothetical protein
MRNDTYDCDWAGIHYRVSTPTEGVETKRLTSIYRWDKETHEEKLIAEWHREWGTGAGHKFRFLTGEDAEQEFQSVNDVYPMTWGYAWGGLTYVRSLVVVRYLHVELNITFNTKQKPYIHRKQRKEIHMERANALTKCACMRSHLFRKSMTETPYVQLYRDDDETKTPIAEYHSINKVFNKRKAFLKVQPEALEFLDTLIGSCRLALPSCSGPSHTLPVTFMFSEKKRRDALKSRGTGVGGP